MNKILYEYFGYKKLKDKQEEIIKSIINKNDTIGILATGYGKSICYQLPYLLTKKSVLVISPLISLMEDQKYKLQKLNINVYCLNSNNSNKQKDKYDLLNGKSGIIYVSPEYLLNSKEFINDLSKKNLLSLIAIDESHCISTWSEFRPEYKELNILKEIIKDIPILALTATATPKIISDIKLVLKLKNPNVIMSSFYRENLNINVIRKYELSLDFKEIVDLIKNVNKDDKIIIYCKTKDETDNFVIKLKENKIKSKSYHAGKTMLVRNKIQEKFIKGEVNIIIATIAFGMGIDLPNIRLVINYGISKDIESFYQEIGRAGRDGNKSDVYVYWSNNDFNINKSFLNDIKDIEFKKKQMHRILEMEKFVNCTCCRMKYITKYFGEDMDDCGHCDNCLSNNEKEKQDITNESFHILKLVKKLKINYGISMLSDILLGSTSKKINEDLKSKKFFGSLKNITKEKIKDIIKFLLINDYLIEVKLDKAFGSVIKINKKGLDWINENNNLDEIEEKSKIYQIIIVCKNSNIDDNKNIEKKLKDYRNKIAKEKGLKLFQIFPNRTIDCLLKIRVNNIKDFKNIEGLGQKRIELYGNDLLNILRDNPLKVTKKQNAYDKLLELGLSLDEISSIKDEFIKEI